jgi:hypothetical protein
VIQSWNAQTARTTAIPLRTAGRTPAQIVLNCSNGWRQLVQ